MTESEDGVRTLLRAAVPEPTRVFDGAQIRSAAAATVTDLPRSRSWLTTVSVLCAAAAVVIVAFVAADLGRHGQHASSPAATIPISSPVVRPVIPAECVTDALVFQADSVTPDTGGGTAIVTIRDGGRSACTLPALPDLHLVFLGITVSALPASRYEPLEPVVITRNQPARISIALRPVRTCDGVGTGRTKIALVSGQFTYSFPLDIDGCQYSIRSATVHSH